jgi:hypothetical protein
MARIGFWAFILGLIISVIGGIFFPKDAWIIPVLVILGLIVGFLNVTAKETVIFLVSTIALIVVGGVFQPLNTLGIGGTLDNILRLVAALMAPAAIVVAIKALWAVGKPGE